MSSGPSKTFGANLRLLAAAAVASAALLAGGAAPSAAQNLLTNPHFDTGLSGWTAVEASWDATLDAEDASSSGSARAIFDPVSGNGDGVIISQCVPITVAGRYLFGGKIYLSPDSTGQGAAYFWAIVSNASSPGCSELKRPPSFVATSAVETAGVWTSSLGIVSADAGQSVMISALLGHESLGRIQANFDDLVFEPTTLTCLPDANTLCLQGGRFAVKATFRVAGGSAHAAHVGQIGDSGYLWFFDPGNVEAMVKVIDGCGLGGHYWVFLAGLTNLEVDVQVTDTKAGLFRDYFNPPNTAFRPVQDTAAFPCS